MSAAFLAWNRKGVPSSSLLTRISSFSGQQKRCLLSAAAAVDQDPQQQKQRLATIRLYRILQRTCRSFANKDESSEDQILLQPLLEAPDWGRHLIFIPPTPTQIEELYRLFYVWNDDSNDDAAFAPSSIDDWYYEVVGKLAEESLPAMTSMTCWTTSDQLKKAVREAFRVSYDLDAPSLHKWSIRAVQQLQEQKKMKVNSSIATTEGVRVTATSRCIGTTSPAASLPPTATPAMLERKYRFAYRIRVENVSDHRVQLLGRYWHIEETTEAGKSDDARPPVVVDAPVTGAVGHLPVLRPGQVFEYMSGTDLTTARGIMKGHLYMARVSDDAMSAKSGDDLEALKGLDAFEVIVAPFPLVAN